MLTRAQVPHQYEHTGILSDGSVVHYTCNAPSYETMGRYGIKSLQGLNGGDGRGVLVIPGDVFSKFGYRIDLSTDKNVLKITSENLMARL
ncbi:MAG: hypothetical protein V1813_02780 [Candidatus Aenigmatarchaeota archaeon]